MRTYPEITGYTIASAIKFSCCRCITILDYSILGKKMAHTSKDKEKLLTRVRRIRGQVDAIERALDSEQECAGVLQLMAACRGALNGLMAEVMEGHVRFHVLSPDKRQELSPDGSCRRIDRCSASLFEVAL